MNLKKHIMTLDAGSGSGRAVLFDSDGVEVSFAQKEWLPKTIPEYPGSYVFDTKEAWEILGACSREAIEKAGVLPEQVIGVSATSQRDPSSIAITSDCGSETEKRYPFRVSLKASGSTPKIRVI